MINLKSNSPLYRRLQRMATTPRAQIKRLAIGSLASLLIMLALVLTSELENQLVFYSLSGLLAIAVGYAIPGYIGVWVWRMQKVLFRQEDD